MTTWSLIYNGNTVRVPMISRVLTPDGADISTVTKSSGTVTMSAPPTNNALSNLRKVFYPSDVPAQVDQATSATWVTQSDDKIQEGLAFRITYNNGDVRAITVTKNVIYGVWWVFNVHTWDSASANPFTQIAQFDYSNLTITPDSTETPFPWRTIARVTGSLLEFKLWRTAMESEPSWADPAYVHSATIPPDYLNPGNAGWYVGHIPVGGKATYSSLGLWKG